jgi:hypothetical protein
VIPVRLKKLSKSRSAPGPGFTTLAKRSYLDLRRASVHQWKVCITGHQRLIFASTSVMMRTTTNGLHQILRTHSRKVINQMILALIRVTARLSLETQAMRRVCMIAVQLQHRLEASLAEKCSWNALMHIIGLVERGKRASCRQGRFAHGEWFSVRIARSSS